MIKFFRKIRYDLMEKNKSGKYLKYAIGEIILVVISILIALSINNWNETQKLIKNEKELITSLKKEIANNILELESSIEMNIKFIETAEKLIHSLKLKNDLFSANQIYSSFDYFPYKVNSPVLDRIIATNSNLLIEKKELLAGFRLLKNSYFRIADNQFYLDEFWNSKVTNFLIASGVWAEDEDIDYQITLKELALDGYSKKQFMTMIKIHKGLHNFWKNSKVDATEKSKEILNILNE